MTYDELQKTDLFSFFHFTESGRKRTGSGMYEVYFKPGGFQEFIDVMMSIDNSQVVHQGVLYLDRDWIGSAMTVSPFGKDLAKSFIAAVTPDTDKPKADRIVSTIWNLQGSQDRVVTSTPQEASKHIPIEDLEQVYLGLKDKFEMTFDECCIKIENVQDVGRKRLKISVEEI